MTSNYHFNEEFEHFPPIIPIQEIENEQFNPDEVTNNIPIIPLRNSVFFPKIVMPITVGREKSILAVKNAYKNSKYIGVITQKDTQNEDPAINDLYTIGTVAKILRLISMPDGGTTIIIQGLTRFKLLRFTSTDHFLMGDIDFIYEMESENDEKFKATLDSIKEIFEKILKLSPQFSNEALFLLKNIENPSYILHFIISHISASIEEKQELLEQDDIELKAEKLIILLQKEFSFVELKNKVTTKTKNELDKQQKEYFLQQQLKSIKEELGTENNDKEVAELKRKAETKKWSEDIKKMFEKNIQKLERMHPYTPDYSVTYNHLDLLLDLPWNELTTDNYDLKVASKILEEDHYGMEKIKNRIIEHLAVLKLKGDMKSPILCFLGPPGIGKTSLGKSISRALNRKYDRISLGGLHDEGEIRGHRKTYIGAMPGRIIQTLKKCQSSNPVIILDEIDKIGSDYKGDPSSALLEVLDPEQNHSFYDNYLEAEFDLSKILFIATANNIQHIQPALRDRLEIIELSGYATEEKIEIAKKHLIPKQKTSHGLLNHKIQLSDKVIQKIITSYTRESGVRELDRKMAGVMRYFAKKIVLENEVNFKIDTLQLNEILGWEKYSPDKFRNLLKPGVVPGLAWTSVGGDILIVETVLYKGKGTLNVTGNLGNVMKESASTAFTYIKANCESWNITQEQLTKSNLHLHFPEGATPKDGPSAGITILSSFLSILLNKPIKPKLTMTGEITLRGQVLPVGGIKEKILAAKREGFKEIILCAENKKDIEEIEKSYIKGLTFHFVESMEEVLNLAVLYK